MRVSTPIIEYIADDGTIFRDEQKCLDYEARIAALAEVLKPLGKRPDDETCAFANGEGWVEHDLAVVMRVYVALLDEVSKKIKHKWVDQTRENPTGTHPSWVGRLIDDSGDTPLYRAWERISCIDLKTGREYGQPYFAAHPADATGCGRKPVL